MRKRKPIDLKQVIDPEKAFQYLIDNPELEIEFEDVIYTVGIVFNLIYAKQHRIVNKFFKFVFQQDENNEENDGSGQSQSGEGEPEGEGKPDDSEGENPQDEESDKDEEKESKPKKSKEERQQERKQQREFASQEFDENSPISEEAYDLGYGGTYNPPIIYGESEENALVLEFLFKLINKITNYKWDGAEAVMNHLNNPLAFFKKTKEKNLIDSPIIIVDKNVGYHRKNRNLHESIILGAKYLDLNIWSSNTLRGDFKNEITGENIKGNYFTELFKDQKIISFGQGCGSLDMSTTKVNRNEYHHFTCFHKGGNCGCNQLAFLKSQKNVKIYYEIEEYNSLKDIELAL